MVAFVGREPECARLEEALARALAADTGDDRPPPVVLVSGEAGVGKSRLVEEVLRRLDPEVLVGRGAAFSSDDVVPLVPVAALLRDLLRRLPPSWPTRSWPPCARPWRGCCPSSVPPSCPTARPGRRRAVAAQPARHAPAGRPGGRRRAVGRRVHARPRGPHPAAGARTLRARAGAPQRAAALRPGVARARRPRAPAGALEIRLAPLPHDASARLVREAVDGAVPLDGQRRIIERARGNPLFLEALARSARDDGPSPSCSSRRCSVRCATSPARRSRSATPLPSGRARASRGARLPRVARPRRLRPALAGGPRRGRARRRRRARRRAPPAAPRGAARRPHRRTPHELTGDAAALLGERIAAGEASVRDHASMAACSSASAAPRRRPSLTSARRR